MSARRLPSVGVTGWEFPRAAAGVRHLVGWAERAGLRAEPLLVGTGLARDDLDRVGTVTAAQELQVARALARRAPHAAADVGRRYTAESFGVMGWAITSSATVGDAADVALRFIDLSFAFVLPVVRLEGDRVVAELDASALPADVRRWLLVRDTTTVATVLDSLVPGGVGVVISVEGDGATLAFPASVTAGRTGRPPRPPASGWPTSTATCRRRRRTCGSWSRSAYATGPRWTRSRRRWG